MASNGASIPSRPVSDQKKPLQRADEVSDVSYTSTSSFKKVCKSSDDDG